MRMPRQFVLSLNVKGAKNNLRFHLPSEVIYPNVIKRKNIFGWLQKSNGPWRKCSELKKMKTQLRIKRKLNMSKKILASIQSWLREKKVGLKIC